MSASSHPPRLPAPGQVAPAAPAYYVPLPRPLLATLRNNLLAIGVYALVARVFRATRAPVPLSPADIVAYDPAVSAAAALRALNRLRALGYLELAPSGGLRNAYRPTWGVVGGAPRPWELGAPILGRPPHISPERLPQDLLDRYLGRLEPHAQRGAHVSRYTTVPLLGLADVGAYALALAGYPAQSATLAGLGLLAGGRALALPEASATLALVSQRRLLEADSPVALTDAGWHRLGMAPPPPTTPAGQPLVFVSAGQSGHPGADVIGHPIGVRSAAAPAPTASGRQRGRAAPPAAGSHGISSSHGSEDSPPGPPERSRAPAGGGSDHLAGQHAGPPPPEQPSAITRLLALGVRRDVAQALGGRPLAQVDRVIAQARARPGVRDLAAWVVAALRALPADEPAAPPPLPRVSDLAILTHPGLSNAERTRWLTRFRNADPAERPAVLMRFHAEAGGER